MKSYVLLLALLQSLGCSGIPLHNTELESMADRGLGAVLAEVNSAYAVSHLYRMTRGSVSRVIPVGLNTVDLLMKFGVKETECLKASRNDPQTCAFRPGFFVPSFSCFSRVRISATSTQVVSLRCGHDESSSSESSEEMFSRGRHQYNIPFANRVPAPSAPPPPIQPGRSFQSQTVEVRPRGDAFSNFLV
ncbi:secreted phosphoprotein 24 isoform X2 [Micropterus salmoides]|uniref:secreted phosphoprotein 24 isoform X2 n=1 Tax=Micropterus salmoides TaxID=27706 RepID=UPI0018EAA13F|nr:secreted phosphoprotein 24 isoform X2 [Micropterus salmoides]